MKELSNNRRLAIVLLLALAGLAVGAFARGGGSTPTDTTTGSAVHYSTKPLDVPQAKGNASPQQTLDDIVANVGGNTIASAKLGGPPPDLQPSEDPNAPHPKGWDAGRWLYLLVDAPDNSPAGTTKPIWIANLVVGALRDELFKNQNAPVISSRISVQLPDGTILRNIGGGVGDVELGQVFSSASDSDIRNSINAAASTAGYTVDSIDIMHADQPAPAVVLVTDDPSAAATDPDSLLTAIFGPPGTYEGEYLEVRGPDGTVALIQGSSFRTGVGQRWVNQAFGGNNGGPAAGPSTP